MKEIKTRKMVSKKQARIIANQRIFQVKTMRVENEMLRHFTPRDYNKKNIWSRKTSKC